MNRLKVIIAVLVVYSCFITTYAITLSSSKVDASVNIQTQTESKQDKDSEEALREAYENAANVKPSGEAFETKFQW